MFRRKFKQQINNWKYVTIRPHIKCVISTAFNKSITIKDEKKFYRLKICLNEKWLKYNELEWNNFFFFLLKQGYLTFFNIFFLHLFSSHLTNVSWEPVLMEIQIPCFVAKCPLSIYSMNTSLQIKWQLYTV